MHSHRGRWENGLARDKVKTESDQCLYRDLVKSCVWKEHGRDWSLGSVGELPHGVLSATDLVAMLRYGDLQGMRGAFAVE
jgi:hypothetical protein